MPARRVACGVVAAIVPAATALSAQALGAAATPRSYALPAGELRLSDVRRQRLHGAAPAALNGAPPRSARRTIL